MDKRVAKLWVDALRSGKYVQGHGQLKNSHNGAATYCCLGVLTELYIEEIQASQTFTNFFLDRLLLAEEVAIWAGFFENNMRGERMGGNPLAVLNDGLDNGKNRKYSFEEIADIIEAEVETL
jgi:hypothetical protein